MELIQIVPILPPALSGVGDYALLLARELRDAQNVQTRFLVGDPAWATHEAAAAPFPARALPGRTSGTLLRALETEEAAGGGPPGAVLLHYVGYGYAHRGCPFWLVAAAERWKRARPGRRLVVLFHELYATGPVWSSVFWTGPFQKNLAARLGRAADARRMTTALAAGQLRTLLGRPGADAAIDATPVFSTLGEPAAPPPLAMRRRQIVVFGSRAWRQDVYTRGMADLTDACRRLEIECVVDVGAPLAAVPGGGLPVPLEVAGPLPAAQASALFADSLAGYFSYPVPSLAKSTIFAAYCAHGMVPLTTPDNCQPNPDGLAAGTHFLAGIASPTPDLAVLARVASAAREWYDVHRLAVHAAGVRWQVTPLDPKLDSA